MNVNRKSAASIAAGQWELFVRLSVLIVSAQPSAPLSDAAHLGQRPVAV